MTLCYGTLRASESCSAMRAAPRSGPVSGLVPTEHCPSNTMCYIDRDVHQGPGFAPEPGRAHGSDGPHGLERRPVTTVTTAAQRNFCASSPPPCRPRTRAHSRAGTAAAVAWPWVIIIIVQPRGPRRKQQAKTATHTSQMATSASTSSSHGGACRGAGARPRRRARRWPS